jgi:uncharacterized protein
MNNAMTWFEIPSVNFDRAVEFYNQVLNVSLRKEIFGGIPNGIFPYAESGIGGAVVHSSEYQPSTSGTLVYLNAGNDLDGAIARVEAAGGKVLMPKTDIGDPGYISIILDTEGNKIALHMPKSA